MAALDLESLAADTAQRLHAVWDELGIPAPERDEFLSKLSQDVAAIYQTRVDNQRMRKTNTEMEIVQLQNTIVSLQNAMEEQPALPIVDGLSLIQKRDTLETKRAALQEVWDQRYTELRSLEKALFKLYEDIASDPAPAFASIGDMMSFERISQYQAETSRVEAVKAERATTIASLCQEISDLWRELVVSPSDDFDQAIVTGCEGCGWGLNVIASLNGRKAELLAEKEAREAKVMALGEAITSLWKRLMTPVELQTQFLDANSGISDEVVEACEAYLAQLQVEFSSKLTSLIGHARSTLHGLWDELRMGGEEARRADFPAAFLAPAEEGEMPVEGATAQFTDDLYQAHEDHIRALTALCEERRPILSDIGRREAMLADKAEYEAIVSDPARLLVKGSSAARLREEKLERRVKKELPALSKKLRAVLEAWEAKAGAPFLVDGARWLDRLDAEESSEAARHAEDRAKRDADRKTKAGIPPSVEAPGLPAAALAATGKAGVYRPAVLNATLAGGGKGGSAAPGLGMTQALPKGGGSKKSSSTPAEAEGAEVGASKAAAAPPAPGGLSNKAKSFANSKPAPAMAKAPLVPPASSSDLLPAPVTPVEGVAGM